MRSAAMPASVVADARPGHWRAGAGSVVWDWLIGRPPSSCGAYCSDRGDLRSRGALGALRSDVGDLRALGEGLEPRAGDLAVVDEQVLRPIVGDDEAESLV